MKKLFEVRDAAHPLTDEELIVWLREMRGNPHVPESNFDVGVLFKAEAGGKLYYFSGVNVENVDHRLSTHGEEGAASAMITALGKFAQVKDVYVMAAPKGMELDSAHPLTDSCTPCCGKCRQLLVNLGTPQTEIHAFALNGRKEDSTLGELLPKDFNFTHFVPELAAGQRPDMPTLSIEEIESKLIRIGNLTDQQIGQWMSSLESYDFASQRTDAVILKLSNGAYIAGVKVEEAGFNGPSAAQAALAIANARFGDEDFTIEKVYSTSRSRNAAPGQDYRGLSLAEVQCLFEHGATPDSKVTAFNQDGETISYALKEAAFVAPTTKKQNFTDFDLAKIRQEAGKNFSGDLDMQKQSRARK